MPILSHYGRGGGGVTDRKISIIMIRHRHVKEVTHCNLIKAGEEWAEGSKDFSYILESLYL